MDKVLEIEVFGRTYKIRVKGEEDEEYVGRLTSYVDQKMHEIAVKSRSSDPLKIAVLALMNIADECFASRKELDQLDAVLGQMESDIDRVENRFSPDGAYRGRDESAP
ncbi:MAG: cell division protein ZapA [Acidobacteriota bacterium]|jgi:cell division protein ZapA|nr:cell division protein ZapA [Acidobacteriota bacterium]